MTKTAKHEEQNYTVVSQRNEFFSIQDEVERKLLALDPTRPIDLRSEATKESFENWLTDFALTILRRAHWAFKRASEQGMEEAERLVQDPNYYETLRARRQRQKHSSVEYAAKMKREQQQRELDRTPDVLQEEIDQVDRQVENYETRIARLKVRREDLVNLLKLKQSNRQFRVVEPLQEN